MNNTNPTMLLQDSKWCRNGLLIPSLKIKDWIKKYNLPLADGTVTLDVHIKQNSTVFKTENDQSQFVKEITEWNINIQDFNNWVLYYNTNDKMEYNLL